MAGGAGSRLRPLTIGRPKPLVPLVNQPVIAHIRDLLLYHGVQDIVATVQYMSEMLMKLPSETRGLAPRTGRASVLAMSGIGWIVDEPNTASLPANLLAQSCVPDEK